ncbi:MAG: nucleoside-diphosphate kinase, partial [Candidatus Rhabdochlamydia sp.]
DFGASIERNAIHGSDTSENAKTEISFFFQPQAIFIH